VTAVEPIEHACEGLQVTLLNGVLTLTLDRPEAGNAINATQREALLEQLARADEDAAIRVVVLAARGRFFCTGADLRGTPPSPPRPEGAPERLVGDIRRTLMRAALRLVSAVLDCEKPVIAAVQGTAAGLGAHLAFACDLVVASEDATFIEVFARRGLLADALGTWLLPRMVGLQRAKELVLLAEDVPARRAYEIGLVTRVVPADGLDDEVRRLADQLAAGPTRAFTADKFLLNRSFDVDRHTLAAEEAWLVDALAATHDAQEGVASFVERRTPHFRGY
jgi:2-(1,2-epoxy-1,2-dihydrophenyl)acetyl-CoA isomerase